MSLSRIAAATLLAAGVLSSSATLPAAGTPSTASPAWTPASAASAPRLRALAQSPELWATVNVCNAPLHPNTIGIRGSMPTDGHPRDMMYMRFLVQSLNPSTGLWTNLGEGADSGFVAVGPARATRQAGRTFELKPTSVAYTLRGRVEFQWRRSGRLVHLASRPTTAGHTSLAGAEPKGFSAATCVLP
jgi:hypothetical protein